MKKKIILVPLVLLIVGGLIASCAAPAPAPAPGPAPAPAPAPAPETTTLKLVSTFFSDDPLTLPVFQFIDKVNERGNGELIIEYVGGPEVIGSFTLYEAVAEGRMDIGHTIGAFSAMLPPPFL